MLIVVYAGITADFAWFWVLLTVFLRVAPCCSAMEEIILWELSWMAGNGDHGSSVGRNYLILDLSAAV